MCDVSSAVAIGTMVVGTASAIYEQEQKNTQAADNTAAAQAAAKRSNTSLSLRQMQETDLTNQSIFQTDLQARRAKAEASLMAGEAGVGGVSIDLLLNDIDRQAAASDKRARENLENTKDQIKNQRGAIDAEMQNRINSVPGGDPWATGIRIGNSALEGYGQYKRFQNGDVGSGK